MIGPCLVTGQNSIDIIIIIAQSLLHVRNNFDCLRVSQTLQNFTVLRHSDSVGYQRMQCVLQYKVQSYYAFTHAQNQNPLKIAPTHEASSKHSYIYSQKQVTL